MTANQSRVWALTGLLACNRCLMSALGHKRKCSNRANNVRFPPYSDRTADVVYVVSLPTTVHE
jgi:hypothetical protein